MGTDNRSFAISQLLEPEGTLNRPMALLALIIAIAFPLDSKADLASNRLLKTPNLDPLAILAHTPASQTAYLVPEKTLQVSLSQSLANNFVQSASKGEALWLDGESSATDVTLSYGLPNNLELSLAISYLRHSGGRLDKLINKWHQGFGLPSGDRHLVADNQLNYRWTENSKDLIHTRSSVSGVGDTVIGLGRNLRTSPGQRVTLRWALNLPTGNSDKLVGSGATALSTFLIASRVLHFMPSSSVAHLGVGATFANHLAESDIPHRGISASAYAGLATKVTEQLWLKTRITYAQGRFNSSIPELGKGKARLVFGGSFLLTPRRAIDLAVVEDISVGRSPDVSFHASFNARF